MPQTTPTYGWNRASARERSDGRKPGTLYVSTADGRERSIAANGHNDGSAIIHTRNPNGAWSLIYVAADGTVGPYGVGDTRDAAYAHLREMMGE